MKDFDKKELNTLSFVTGEKEEDILKDMKGKRHKELTKFANLLENITNKYKNNNDSKGLCEFYIHIMALVLYLIPPKIRIDLFEQVMLKAENTQLKLKEMKELMKNESVKTA